MKLTIPGTLPSLNEMINASKRNKYAYVKMKDTAIRLVVWSAKISKVQPITEKHDYEITWFCPNMRKDKDNIVAGQKFIWDGLQELGILKNDGWGQIGKVTHDHQIDKKNPRIEVRTIQEVPA